MLFRFAAAFSNSNLFSMLKQNKTNMHYEIICIIILTKNVQNNEKYK